MPARINMPNSYIGTTGSITGSFEQYTISNSLAYSDGLVSFTSSSDSKRGEKGIRAELYFKYVKSKFGTLEGMRINSRLKRLEKAFYKAVDNGQDMLAEKFMIELAAHARESAMYAKGIRHFIEAEDLKKHKRNIRGGHISDTLFKKYVRIIPEDVLAAKKKYDGIFDDHVIYHYYDEKAEEKREKGQKLTSSEKSAMRDPVLFGIIQETDRLYFIADWEDEFCDLTFDQMVDAISGKKDEDFELTKEIKGDIIKS